MHLNPFFCYVKLTHHSSPVCIPVRDRETGSETKKALVEYLAETCPSLIGDKARFTVTPWLFNGHLQTWFSSYWNSLHRGYNAMYERYVIHPSRTIHLSFLRS